MRLFIKVLLVVVVLTSFQQTVVANGTKEAKKDTPKTIKTAPNLLFVFPDQMRLPAMGFWKKPKFKDLLRTETDPVHTPNIDRLAENGLVFTQVTSTHPLCSPHRAMLMSGIYSRRNGVTGNCAKGRKTGMHHNIRCFTDVLADAGYETAYVGKTHWERTEPLFDEEFNYVGTNKAPGGNYANSYDTYIPPGRGRLSNKYWFQLFRDTHFDPLAYSNRPELVNGNKDGQVFQPKRFTPEVEADAVIQFLENKNGERDADKPFSMFWAPNPPHNPYSSVDDCEKDIYEKYYQDMPLEEQMYRNNIQPYVPKKESHIKFNPVSCTAIYYSLVTGIDRQLGRILDALEKTGQAENTIVVFTADHGEMMGSQGRMGKGTYHDESFLVPFLIYYPTTIKPRAEDLKLQTVDIMPSILGLLGLHDNIPQTVEGVDYSRGIATGNYTTCPKPESALYLTGKRKGIRTDQYTYVVSDEGIVEVLDNLNDPYQLNVLTPEEIPSADFQELKQELGKRLLSAKDEWAEMKKFPDYITY